MLYTVEFELSEFQAWGGAAPRLAELVEHPAAYDYVSDTIDELSSPNAELWTETDVNDFIWFDMDDILTEAGYMDAAGHYTSDAD